MKAFVIQHKTKQKWVSNHRYGPQFTDNFAHCKLFNERGAKQTYTYRSKTPCGRWGVSGYVIMENPYKNYHVVVYDLTNPTPLCSTNQ